MPLFSIIVPIYNVEKFLEQMILSVLAQTYKNFELILVDDGSCDSSASLCRKYQLLDSRIIFLSKDNEGPCSARRMASKIACGDYIVCVDGDDWISINYLEEFNDIINKYKPDIICCGSVWTDGIKHIYKGVGVNEGFYSKKSIEAKIYPILIESSTGNYFPNSLWAKAIKRELFNNEQQLVNISIKIGEDAACVKPCIFKANSLYILNKDLYYYRLNLTSITKVKKPFDWKYPELIGRHYEMQLPMNIYDFQDQINRNVTHYLFNVAMSQFNCKNTYFETKASIQSHLMSPYYIKAVKNCKYSGLYLKGNFAKFILKNKLTFLIKIIHDLNIG